jgi:hypothetical protein
MTTFWNDFALLYAAALLGALALTPYSLRLITQSGRPLKASPRTLLLAALGQNGVLFAVVVAVGLLAARAVGFGGPWRGSQLGFAWAAGLGGVAGLGLLAADLVLLPRLPALLELARKASLLENALASFYGGVNEELLTRLLGVSGLTWLIWQLRRGPAPTDWMVWTAIAAMAIVFALGHLPAVSAVGGGLTPLSLFRTVALNTPLAVICGWLFWRFGIAAAITAHFAADIVYHVGGTALLQANDRGRFLSWIPPPADPPERPM